MPLGHLAVIGGTGLNDLSDLDITGQEKVTTPYGEASAPLVRGRLADKPLVFLARHGEGHRIPPHAINYRANIQALKQAGVQAVIAVAAVGGIREDMVPGSVALPDQIIDYSWGRSHSFYDGSDGGLEHIEFDPPYDESLRQSLLDAAVQAGIDLIPDGTYGCTQGPRLETAAEIRRMRQDGCDIVGMTGMPEAALAREAGLAYACLAVNVNWAAGLGAPGEGIHDQIQQALETGMDKARQLLRAICR